MQVKILTLNLWNGNLLDKAIHFLQHQTADIILIQEVYDLKRGDIDKRFNSYQVLAEILPTYQGVFSSCIIDRRQKEGKVPNGNAIFSKFPIYDPSMVFIDVPLGEYDHDSTIDFSSWPAGFQISSATVEDQNIFLANVHGPVYLDGDAPTDRRKKLVASLVSKVGGHEKFIIGGDFNMMIDNQAFDPLLAVAQPIFSRSELSTTFNMKRKTNPGYAKAAVDNLLVHRSAKVIAKKLFSEEDVSDHYPMMAVIEL